MNFTKSSIVYIIKISISLLLISSSFVIKAQDTLPKFNVYDIGKKVQISWINPFPNCLQISVQRSFDSTKFFSTIFSPQSPNLPQNGFADVKMPAGVKAFYRIFYVLEGGSYFFSKSQSVSTSIPNIVKKETTEKKEDENEMDDKVFFKGKKGVKIENTSKEMGKIKEAEPKILVSIYKRTTDSLLFQVEYALYKRFKDSILQKTKDTLFLNSATEIILKPFVPKPVWKASNFIFTNTDGYVKMQFDHVIKKNYRAVFYNDNNEVVFEIKKIKEPVLYLDVTNFGKYGWYFFDLYEDGLLKEKNKFYVGKF